MTWRPTLWLVALLVVVADQLTKQWALTALAGGRRIEVLGDWLSFTLAFNSGAAFSLGNQYTWVLTVVAVAITVGIVYFSRHAAGTSRVVLFGAGLGGALGNLIDRLFRAPGFAEGHVVDMINYGGLFVGNVADIAIVGAASVAVVLGLLGKPLLITSEEDKDAPPASAPADEGRRERRERAEEHGE